MVVHDCDPITQETEAGESCLKPAWIIKSDFVRKNVHISTSYTSEDGITEAPSGCEKSGAQPACPPGTLRPSSCFIASHQPLKSRLPHRVCLSHPSSSVSFATPPQANLQHEICCVVWLLCGTAWPQPAKVLSQLNPIMGVMVATDNPSTGQVEAERSEVESQSWLHDTFLFVLFVWDRVSP